MSGYNKLNKICDDCFALYKEPEVYTFCRFDLGQLACERCEKCVNS
jgi:hypothetical protein